MKEVLLLVALLALLPLISAESTGVCPTIFCGKQYASVNIIKTCENSTYSNLTRLVYPNTTLALNGQFNMSKSGDDYLYANNLTSGVGTYLVYGICDENGVKGNWQFSYFISKNGEAPAGDNFIIFTYILFIVAAVGMFSMFIFTLAKLVTASETLFGVLTSWSFLLLMLIANYMAKSYILSDFIQNISESFLTTAFMWVAGFLPLVGLVITIFIKGTQKKKPLGVQEFTGRMYSNG